MSNKDVAEKVVEETALDRYKKKIDSAFERMKDEVKYAETDICNKAKKIADLFPREDEDSFKLKQEAFIEFREAQMKKLIWEQAINKLKVAITYD
jgi:hypothetical protein